MNTSILMPNGNSLTRTSKDATSVDLKEEEFSPKLRVLAGGLLLAAAVLPPIAKVAAPIAFTLQIVADANDALSVAA